MNTTFNVSPGEQSQAIPVYLVQTGGENRLLDIGAFSAGVTIQFSSGAGASFYTTSSASIPADWTDRIASKSIFDNNEKSLRLDSVTDGTPFKGTYLQIGSFRMTGGLDGNLTMLTTSLVRNPGDINLLIDFTEISPAAANPNNLTFGSATVITAVPEPSTMILVGLAAGSMGIATWRKRRRLANRIPA